MKKVNIFTIFLIITSLFFIIISWQVCLPDGCFFIPQQQVCQDGNCINENINDHFSERVDLFSATTQNTRTLLGLTIFLFLAIAFFVDRKYKLLQINIDSQIISQKFALTHSRLSFLFSKGLLHPKIY